MTNRDDLLLEVAALAEAAKRYDLDAVRRHHDRLVAAIEQHVPADASTSVCGECEVGGGLHAEGCSRAGSSRPEPRLWWKDQP